MKRIFCCVLLFFLQTSWTWAEEWTVWTPAPAGGTQVAQWEVRPNFADKTEVAFFLKDQPEPLYLVRTRDDETRIEFSSGMVRRFAPGPLVVTDLPMPLIVPPAVIQENMTCCSVEYTGGMEFKTCTEIVMLNSLAAAMALPAPQPGVLYLVLDAQGPSALIGVGFRAERQ